jgi:hypothetical protein
VASSFGPVSLDGFDSKGRHALLRITFERLQSLLGMRWQIRSFFDDEALDFLVDHALPGKPLGKNRGEIKFGRWCEECGLVGVARVRETKRSGPVERPHRLLHLQESERVLRCEEQVVDRIVPSISHSKIADEADHAGKRGLIKGLCRIGLVRRLPDLLRCERVADEAVDVVGKYTVPALR